MPKQSYNHQCVRISDGKYRLTWSIDRVRPGGILAYPASFERVSTERGAKRFCKSHGIDFPVRKDTDHA